MMSNYEVSKIRWDLMIQDFVRKEEDFRVDSGCKSVSSRFMNT